MNILIFNERDRSDNFYSLLSHTNTGVGGVTLHFMNELSDYEEYKKKNLKTDVSIVVDDLTFFMNVHLEGLVYFRVKDLSKHLDQTFLYNIVVNMNLSGIFVPTEDDLYTFCDRKFFFLKNRRNKNGHFMVIVIKDNGEEIERRIKSDLYDFERIRNKTKFYHYVSDKTPMKTYIVNLEKRTDRKNEMVVKVDNILHDVEFFKAVNGRVDPRITPEDLAIFRLTETYVFKKKNPYGYISKNGEFGCALSHYFIWKDIIQKVDAGVYDESEILCVFEDDISFTTRYSEKFMKTLSLLSVTEGWQCCFLGNTDDIPGIDKIAGAFDPCLSLYKINGHSKRSHAGGTFAYLINYKGAKAFIDCTQRHGIPQAIDWFMFEMADEIGIYKTYPHLVTAEVAVDTDIQ
jgi:GR25 family glycosyltransferase involved in LPS biosynthesis